MSSTVTTRFQFGKNWADFLSQISVENFQKALESFQQFSGKERLDGLRFLDVGCGSGIHSWVAQRLGAAAIVSFDYDLHSVNTSLQLKQARAPEAAHWTIRQGDILNRDFAQSLGQFDYVYAWGVLHHTGQMWQAIENTLERVAPGGWLHLALYNRHWSSPLWKGIKWTYCHSPAMLQKGMLYSYAGLSYLRAWIRRRGHTADWIAGYSSDRGMLWFNNLHDWLGGYPYEYASPAEVQDFLARHDFSVLKINPNPGTGCSEFLFRRRGA